MLGCSVRVRVTRSTNATYDLNGDGEIGFSDFVVFAQNFGKDAPSPVVKIPDANLRPAIETALGKDSGAPITRAEMATMDSLEASDADIDDLTGLESAVNLTWLDLASNDITNVSVLEGLTNLTHLILSGNNITDLASLVANTGLGAGDTVDLSDNPLNVTSQSTHIPALQARGVSISFVAPAVAIPDANLRVAIEAALNKATGAPITQAEMATLDSLEASDAEITDLTGLESAVNLTYLSLNDNNITNISALGKSTNLERLWLSNNRIEDISALSKLANLTELWLWNNQIEDISALSGLTNLTRLSLGLNNITDISALSGLTSLTQLRFGGNRISDISVLAGLTNLTELWLWKNNIEDISPLAGLTNLVELRLGQNNITDISPLSGLTNLTELWLWDNQIEDISALTGLTKLARLSLGLNNITDISALSGLTRLAELDLRGNTLSDSSVNVHILVLESNGVTVRFDSFRKGDFDIELVFLGPFTDSQKNVLQYVARRWMAVIAKDLPDFEFTQGWSGTCGGQSYEIPSGERIDDLRIYVSTFDDDDNRIVAVGYGGPHLLREETRLPVLGCTAFDLKRANLLITGQHEIGHVLGFGPVWRDLGFLQDPNGDTHFNGPLAIAAFNDAGGRDYTGAKVPVSRDGAHWRVPLLSGELMGPGGGGALSAITVQSLADVGYGVDISQADAYTLPGAAGKAGAKIAVGIPPIVGDGGRTGRLDSAEGVWGRGMNFNLWKNRQMRRGAPPTNAEPELTCGAGLMNEPIYVVDPQGRVVRTIRQ